MPPKIIKRASPKKPSPSAKASPTAADPLPSVVGESADPVAMDAEGARETPTEETLEEKIGDETDADKAAEETTEDKSHEEATAASEDEDNAMESEPEEEEAEPEEEEEEEDEEEQAEGDREKGEGEVELGNKDVPDGDVSLGKGNNVSNGHGDDEGNEKDYIQAPPTEGKKQNEYMVFIRRLDKRAVEEDLIGVFGAFGDIQSIKIPKNPATQKNKGYAIICYASAEHAKKAIAELKDGAEVKGKQIRVSACSENDTLYVRNICKTWTKNQVIETLKNYGVEQIQEILIPDDPRDEGKIKGFAFLKFGCYSDGSTAYQLLKKPGAVFGRDISAEVAFVKTPLYFSEEKLLLEVKTVHIEGIPKSWDEAKIRELCKQFGDIEQIRPQRNLPLAKRKDFAFIEFTSRDGAVACLEGITSAQLGEGDIKVKASMAKPVFRAPLDKWNVAGGHKVQKNGEAIEESGNPKKRKGKSKVVQVKEVSQSNLKSANKNVPSKSQNKRSSEKKRDRRGVYTTTDQQPSKKARNNHSSGATNQQPSNKVRNKHNSGRGHDRSFNNFTNTRSSYSSMQHLPHQTSYTRSYAQPATSYLATAYAAAPGSRHSHRDLQPHAGCVPPAEPVQSPYEYDLRRGAYYSQPRNTSYAGAHTVQSYYPEYSRYAGPEAGYAYPNTGAYPYRRAYN